MSITYLQVYVQRVHVATEAERTAYEEKKRHTQECMASDWFKIGPTQSKAINRQSRQIQVYLARFKPKKRYAMLMLANRRAPGVFVFLLLRGTIVNRTYGIHKNLYV